MNLRNMRPPVPLDSVTNGQLAATFDSATCPACGGSKMAGANLLCGGCWDLLSRPNRLRLVKAAGDRRYGAAVRAAIGSLGVVTVRLAPGRVA